MRIAITEFVTLDGVSQGPGSPTEDTSDGFTRGGWFVPHLDQQFVWRASEWLDLADGATRYIGRLGLTDAEHTSLLTDWRAPAAQAFYRATAAHADDVDPPGRGEVEERLGDGR